MKNEHNTTYEENMEILAGHELRSDKCTEIRKNRKNVDLPQMNFEAFRGVSRHKSATYGLQVRKYNLIQNERNKTQTALSERRWNYQK